MAMIIMHESHQVPHLSHYLGRWSAQQVCDELQLVNHIPAWEERLAKQDLSKDAAYAPNVNGWRVLCKEGTTQLWRSVPPSGHIVCPEDGGRHVIEGRPGQAKVTDLELAIRVSKDVLGFEIPVKHLGCSKMHSCH